MEIKVDGEFYTYEKNIGGEWTLGFFDKDDMREYESLKPDQKAFLAGLETAIEAVLTFTANCSKYNYFSEVEDTAFLGDNSRLDTLARIKKEVLDKAVECIIQDIGVEQNEFLTSFLDNNACEEETEEVAETTE